MTCADVALDLAERQFNRLTTPDSDDSSTDLPQIGFNRNTSPFSELSLTSLETCASRSWEIGYTKRVLQQSLKDAGYTTATEHLFCGLRSNGHIFWNDGYRSVLQGIYAQSDFEAFFNRVNELSLSGVNELSASGTERQRCCWPRSKVIKPQSHAQRFSSELNTQEQKDAAIQAYIEEENARMSQNGIKWAYNPQIWTLKLTHEPKLPLPPEEEIAKCLQLRPLRGRGWDSDIMAELLQLGQLRTLLTLPLEQILAIMADDLGQRKANKTKVSM